MMGLSLTSLNVLPCNLVNYQTNIHKFFGCSPFVAIGQWSLSNMSDVLS